MQVLAVMSLSHFNSGAVCCANGADGIAQFARMGTSLCKTEGGMTEMDDIDRALISALRHDARASLSDLAAALGVSRTTIRSRIERLQRSGEIMGFSVVLK